MEESSSAFMSAKPMAIKQCPVQGSLAIFVQPLRILEEKNVGDQAREISCFSFIIMIFLKSQYYRDQVIYWSVENFG